MPDMGKKADFGGDQNQFSAKYDMGYDNTFPEEQKIEEINNQPKEKKKKGKGKKKDNKKKEPDSNLGGGSMSTLNDLPTLGGKPK